MSRRFPTEAKNMYVYGLSGSTRVRFTGDIPHGKSTRQIAIDVHPELIVQIAAALLATKDCACDSDFQRQHRHHSEYGWQPGHALWHVHNPDRPMPCVHGIDVSDALAPIDVGEERDGKET